MVDQSSLSLMMSFEQLGPADRPNWFNDGYPNGMAPLVGLLEMLKMNPPQNVTSRYIRNLLIKGKNDDFVIVGITREHHLADGLNVAFYFMAEVSNFTIARNAAGVTIEQAVHRCLQKYGVTFR